MTPIETIQKFLASATGGAAKIDVADGRAVISAEDIANPPTFTTGVTLRGWSDVDFRGIRFTRPDATEDYHECMRLYDCASVGFFGNDFSGVMVGGWRKGMGVLASSGNSGLVIRGNNFHDCARGAVLLGVTGADVKDNDFVRMGSDAMKIAGCSNIAIAGNLMDGFLYEAGGHPDGIQFQAPASTDVEISDNLIICDPAYRAQGIFLTGARHQKVAIKNNIMVGTLWNGIMIVGDDILVEQNEILFKTDPASSVTKSWVRLEDAVGRVVLNKAMHYLLGPDIVAEGNEQTSEATDEQIAVAISAWLETHRPAIPAPEARAETMPAPAPVVEDPAPAPEAPSEPGNQAAVDFDKAEALRRVTDARALVNECENALGRALYRLDKAIEALG